MREIKREGRKPSPTWAKRFLSEAQSVLENPLVRPSRLRHLADLPEGAREEWEDRAKNWTFGREVVEKQVQLLEVMREYEPEKAEAWERACTPPHFCRDSTVRDAFSGSRRFSPEPDPLPADAPAVAVDVEEGLRWVRAMRIKLTYGPQAGEHITMADVYYTGFLMGALTAMLPARFSERALATGYTHRAGGKKGHERAHGTDTEKNERRKKMQDMFDEEAAKDSGAGICVLRRRVAARWRKETPFGSKRGASVRTLERYTKGPRR